MLTQARLHEALKYDAETGIFTWRVKTCCKVIAGAVAGWVIADGRVMISVDGEKHRAHQIAWVYVHGRWPEHQIDHVNGNPSDNRLCNLREVTDGQNKQNVRVARKHNSSGYLGVYLCKQVNKYKARVVTNKKAKYIGAFDTPEEAHAAYVEAKRALHPFSTI